MTIVGIVQARMGSSRLPGKVMLPMAGRPLVGHIFDRLRATRHIQSIVLATTEDPRNDVLVRFADQEGVLVYRARDEDDITERLHGAAAIAGADAILKVNGDCPLVDPQVMDQLVERFLVGDADYVSNKIRWTWPEGLSAEVIAARALAWCNDNLKDRTSREFIANIIRDDRTLFRVASVEGDRDLTQYKWSVDTMSDFIEVARIVETLHSPSRIFTLAEVLALVEGDRRSGAAATLERTRQ